MLTLLLHTRLLGGLATHRSVAVGDAVVDVVLLLVVVLVVVVLVVVVDVVVEDVIVLVSLVVVLLALVLVTLVVVLALPSLVVVKVIVGVAGAFVEPPGQAKHCTSVRVTWSAWLPKLDANTRGAGRHGIESTLYRSVGSEFQSVPDLSCPKKDDWGDIP